MEYFRYLFREQVRRLLKSFQNWKGFVVWALPVAISIYAVYLAHATASRQDSWEEDRYRPKIVVEGVEFYPPAGHPHLQFDSIPMWRSAAIPVSSIKRLPDSIQLSIYNDGDVMGRIKGEEIFISRPESDAAKKFLQHKLYLIESAGDLPIPSRSKRELNLPWRRTGSPTKSEISMEDIDQALLYANIAETRITVILRYAAYQSDVVTRTFADTAVFRFNGRDWIRYWSTALHQRDTTDAK